MDVCLNLEGRHGVHRKFRCIFKTCESHSTSALRRSSHTLTLFLEHIPQWPRRQLHDQTHRKMISHPLHLRSRSYIRRHRSSPLSADQQRYSASQLQFSARPRLYNVRCHRYLSCPAAAPLYFQQNSPAKKERPLNLAFRLTTCLENGEMWSGETMLLRRCTPRLWKAQH